METREITQVKIYYLVMNGVFDSAEEGHISAVSTSKNRLTEFYNAQLLPIEERFRDDYGRFRSFRRGAFYDFNPLYTFSADQDTFGHGLKEDWLTFDEFENVKRKYYFVEE